MDISVGKHCCRRSRLGVLLLGGKHARPLIPIPRGSGAGARSARTAARIIRRARRWCVSAGVLLLLAALAVGASPAFRHFLQDRTTEELLAAARSNAPLSITLNDYVSSGGEEVPILSAGAEAAINDAAVPAARVVTHPPAASATPAPGAASESGASDAGASASSSRTVTSGGAAAASAPRRTIETLGVMRIPVINLEMPVAEGAGTSELRYALGHHPATPALGAPGYATVFGHRMYSYGRHFNRLDELLPGDEVTVTAGGVQLRYIVDDKLTVLPEEVPYYMTMTSDKARLLLVTCTPVRVASHRLLVFLTLDRDRTDGRTPTPQIAL